MRKRSVCCVAKLSFQMTPGPHGGDAGAGHRSYGQGHNSFENLRVRHKKRGRTVQSLVHGQKEPPWEAAVDNFPRWVPPRVPKTFLKN